MARKKTDRARGGGESNALPAATLGRRVGWIATLGLWAFVAAALVSFDAADPPSHAVAPLNMEIANWCGPVGAYLAYHAYFVLGIGVWVGMIALAVYLGVTATGRVVSHPMIRSVGLIIVCLTVSALHGLVMPTAGPLPSAQGGLLSIFFVTELTTRISWVGSFLALFGAFWVGMIVLSDELVLALPRMIGASLGATRRLPLPQFSMPRILGLRRNEAEDDDEKATAKKSRSRRTRRYDEEVTIDPDAGGIGATDAFDPEEYEHDEEYECEDEEDPEAEYEDGEEYEYEDEEEEEEEEAEPARRRLTREELKQKMAKLPVRMAGKGESIARDEDIPREENFEGYKFPTLELLENPESNYSEKMEKLVRKQAESLEATLQTYNIDGEVAGIESGPVVTLYSVQLAPGTKVAKVSAISSDLARSLRAQNVRIVPNMAGTTAIGIEVPNLHKERVRLKELMSGGHAEGMVLPMFLGKDASGEPLVADLTRMPHMLIAGTTGSGKSVCINSIIMSWLYTKRPDELKLVLVDPKMVELSQFGDIPHLMCPVVTETVRAAAILEWAVTKMEERYELFREAGVRNVGGYNALSEEELYERFQPASDLERAKIPKKLPLMVFVVDELADLIMTTKEVELSIVRIAQKARATGIHLILATQRPQANVVTGLIKSNMPCRVSFKVASGMDSRIVLDQKGAELLLGQGDMMFLSPHSSEIKRAQGTLVTDSETRKVARFLRDVAQPTFERSLIAIRPGADPDAEGLDVAERDPLFDDAVRVIIESGRGSVSLLQRRLAIGYSRASRLVDQMGQAGILGEHKGSVARDVLITLEEWDQMKALEEEEEDGANGSDADWDDDPDAAADPADGELEYEYEEEESGPPLVETVEAADDPVPAEYGDEYRR